jgi:predicted RNA-binding Zn ribbon-like protein
MGGEPLVALDLVDTLMTAVQPEQDLLAPDDQRKAWWEVQSARLPAAAASTHPPDPAAVRRLRAAIRELFDARLEGRMPSATSIEDVNAAAASVPVSPRLSYATDAVGPADPADTAAVGNTRPALRADLRWHTEHGGNVVLAFIAREAIGLLGSPEELSRLRRCANPACSMLFLAETRRRQWCASNVCGNRVRVARHQEKVREERVREEKIRTVERARED